jgi:hypothetical protein
VHKNRIRANILDHGAAYVFLCVGFQVFQILVLKQFRDFKTIFYEYSGKCQIYRGIFFELPKIYNTNTKNVVVCDVTTCSLKDNYHI